MTKGQYAVMERVERTYAAGSARTAALKAVTCQILPGDRIALVGPSGSGKSTLLHLLGGIDRPTAGAISWPVLGPVEDLRPRKVAYVFQSESLIEALTVTENVELALLLAGEKPSEARERAGQVLETLDLASLGERLPEELSGGQAQRIAVARALTLRPRLLLADEPTGRLDHPTAQALFDALLAALEGSDTALVVATHDSAIAKRMKKVWRISHGELEAV